MVRKSMTAGIAAGAHQHQIDGREVKAVDAFAFDRPVAKADLDPLGLARRHGVQGLDGEVQFLEDIQHFPADIAGGAYDGDAIAHNGHVLRTPCARAAGARHVRAGGESGCRPCM